MEARLSTKERDPPFGEIQVSRAPTDRLPRSALPSTANSVIGPPRLIGAGAFAQPESEECFDFLKPRSPLIAVELRKMQREFSIFRHVGFHH
jgi:hypothetical protein